VPCPAWQAGHAAGASAPAPIASSDAAAPFAGASPAWQAGPPSPLPLGLGEARSASTAFCAGHHGGFPSMSLISSVKDRDRSFCPAMIKYSVTFIEQPLCVSHAPPARPCI
jgi:hypothetical protein